MIPVKIQCGCGQRYAFDVEPTDGRMPYSVACPVCGADGTLAADEAISKSLADALELTPTSRRAGVLALAAEPAMHAGTRLTARTGRPVSTLLQPDRGKAEAEARSKICWGDPAEVVLKFAMMQGISRDEARELVSALVRERCGMLRDIGIRKIVTGVPLMCVPLGSFLLFNKIGILPLKLFAVTVMVGLYGAYLVYRGCFMVFLPKFENGDVADK